MNKIEQIGIIVAVIANKLKITERELNDAMIDYDNIKREKSRRLQARRSESIKNAPKEPRNMTKRKRRSITRNKW